MNQTSPLRWYLCLLLFFATTLCFLDRQVLSVLSPEICKEFGMSDQDYSFVTNGFLISYAAMFFLGGVLIDKLGTRFGLGFSVLVWTIASGIHAIIRTPFQMGAARFVLGAGEGGCFPGAAKAAAEWFPKKERALAIGISIGGASLGGIIAPPLTIWLNGLFGWRGAFAATGLFGLIWCVLWFAFYSYASRRGELPTADQDESGSYDKTPTRSSANERQSNERQSNERPSNERSSNEQATFTNSGTTYRLVVAIVGLSLARFIFDPVFYFYMFWIPKYLVQECGANAKIIALTGLPFLAMGITNIIGGFASDWLVRRGVPVLSARRRIMFAAAAVTIASSFVPLFQKNPYVAIFLMSMLMFGHGFWITNYVALISDNFPKKMVATVMGFSGLVGTIGGLAANTAIGYVADQYSFLPIWIASGFLYPLAFFVIRTTVRNIAAPTEQRNPN